MTADAETIDLSRQVDLKACGLTHIGRPQGASHSGLAGPFSGMLRPARTPAHDRLDAITDRGMEILAPRRARRAAQGREPQKYLQRVRPALASARHVDTLVRGQSSQALVRVACHKAHCVQRREVGAERRSQRGVDPATPSRCPCARASPMSQGRNTPPACLIAANKEPSRSVLGPCSQSFAGITRFQGTRHLK